MLALFSNMSPQLVITRELNTHDAHGNQHKTQTTIEFTIMALANASGAAVLNMKEAAAQGKGAVDRMRPASSSLRQIPGAVGTSATVIHGAKSMSETWGPLLLKIKLFTELVDGIAKVRHGSD